MLTPDSPAPEDYYQNNCLTLFGFVLQQYGGLLPDLARQQLERYQALGNDAQRLFARLLTRKGPLIRMDRLDYREIEDLTAALQLLAEQSFIVIDPCAPADQLLALMTKAELFDFAPHKLRKQWTKQSMVACLLSTQSDRRLRQSLTNHFTCLRVSDPDVWWLVRLLYFGDRVQDWSAFVMRDLGMVRYQPVDMLSPRFNSIDALQLDLEYRRYSGLARRISEFPGLAADLQKRMTQPQEHTRLAHDRFTRARRDRTLLRIARWHERLNQLDQAHATYACVEAHPARERIVRILHRQGEHTQAQSCLDDIRAAPLSDEEAQFAQRFGKRGGGYQPPSTQVFIKAARADVEQQALELLMQPAEEGGCAGLHKPLWGAHVENALVRTLTGLIYWDALFADIAGAFTNPFQNAPNDLYHKEFLAPRTDLVAAIESEVASDEAMRSHLLTVAERKWGVSNRLVSWSLFEEVPLQAWIDNIPMAHIRLLTAFMLRHLPERRSGLPDLFVAYGPGQYELIEVKGPNDQLQPGQRVWFQHFERMGIPARVLNLKVQR